MYRIRTQFTATGDRSYLIEANSPDEAYKIFAAHKGELEPEVETYEPQHENTDADEVDIDLVEDGKG